MHRELQIYLKLRMAQSVVVAEYNDCISAEM